MIAMQLDPTSDLRVFDDRDLGWIEELLRLVAATAGQPWRVLLERIEHAPLRIGSRPVPARMRTMIVNALRRAGSEACQASMKDRRLMVHLRDVSDTSPAPSHQCAPAPSTRRMRVPLAAGADTASMPACDSVRAMRESDAVSTLASSSVHALFA